jgi:hypothetical protein
MFVRIGVWESLVIRLFWVQEIECSNHSTPTSVISEHTTFPPSGVKITMRE